MMHHPKPFPRTSRPAFSLVEMLIAVGAVALISVGLAKLFGSVGKTVSVGKRVSQMNEVGALLERQIRSDLAALTRDGFLAIRHIEIQPSGTDAGIPLNVDQAQPRLGGRRLDQLVFFAGGKFASARAPQWEGRQAVGNAARIYYGHGMRLDPDRPPTDPLGYGFLKITEDPAPLQFGAPGPNKFASDWILLRHATVLSRPSVTSAAPVGVPPYLAGNNWRDSSIQIGLQPAAPSVFKYNPYPGVTSLTDSSHDSLGGGVEERVLDSNGRLIGRNTPSYQLSPFWARANETPDWPRFASGMVDVAATDLSLIRNRILAAPARLQKERENGDLTYTAIPSQFRYSANGDELITNPRPWLLTGSAHAMKLLMASAFPGDDRFMLPFGRPDAPRISLADPNAGERRMICAATPPDFTGRALNGSAWNANEPWHQQDQAMLSASNLVIGCTEFIVEWSFGDVYPSEPNVPVNTDPRVGTLIWHGLPRWDDSNSNGQIDSAEPVFAYPYRNNPDFTGSAAWDANLGPDSYTYRVNSIDANLVVNRVARAALIHWPTTVASQDERGRPSVLPEPGIPLYSFFGYLDPTYRKSDPALPDTVDWPWPKLLRFTITVVDPNDLTTEQTFQFIVEVPTDRQAQ